MHRGPDTAPKRARKRAHFAVIAGVAAALLAFSAAAQQPAPRASSAPVTFVGVMPCADCTGIAHTLTLRADGSYRLRSTYLGKPGGPFHETGRWQHSATSDADDGARLTLRSGAHTRRFARKDAATLRLLDRDGRHIASGANLDLRRTAQVDPVDEAQRWRGELVYFADSATFTECASGMRWTVAMRADYLALERDYVQQRSAPGAPLLVEFDGRLAVLEAMEGPAREQIQVDAYRTSAPGASCKTLASGLR